ncbi:rho guanine nucleotide exchange factor 8-like [Hevea brasiliensis]|nr:rho guanine nucleotide exchange factor 8-like [Hevea brasiliensis]
MVTRQRSDLLMNIPALRKLDTILIDQLDQFGNQKEFWYVSRDREDSEQGTPPRNDDKWWIPTVKVPPQGLSERTRRWLQFQKDSVNQVLKAAMAINAQVLSEMEVPDNYIESLPKNGRASLGDSIYKSITVEFFDPEQFLSTMDLSTEHKVLDLKNRIEASIVIWKRKMHQKDGKSSWSSGVSLEKREQFEERAETILIILKQRFPGIPQSVLDISKIQYNKDIGQAILESYSRIIESLAFTILSKIEDILYSDSLTQSPKSESNGRPENEKPEEETDKLSPAETPTATSLTLSDFMGWNVDVKKNNFCNIDDKPTLKPIATKRFSYLEKLESLTLLRSPASRH